MLTPWQKPVLICCINIDGVPLFTKDALRRGEGVVFTLYRCRLTGDTRRWYISIVPMTGHPGTPRDIDLYATLAPSHGEDQILPPRTGWIFGAKGAGTGRLKIENWFRYFKFWSAS